VREVVIVDDDEGFVATLAAILRVEGYRVVAHHTLDAALEYMASNRPDFLITDLRLGAQSGWTLVDFVRLNQPELPVVVVTGFVDEWQDVALRLGTPVFLKPFDPEDLLSFLRHRIRPN
jgi:DNA-binding response OmpR family regulator